MQNEKRTKTLILRNLYVVGTVKQGGDRKIMARETTQLE